MKISCSRATILGLAWTLVTITSLGPSSVSAQSGPPRLAVPDHQSVPSRLSGPPDLKIQGVGLPPDARETCLGSRNTWVVHVLNNGASAAPASKVFLQVQGRTEHRRWFAFNETKRIGILQPGRIAVATFNGVKVPSNADSIVVLAVADRDKQITELQEKNNRWQKAYQIKNVPTCAAVHADRIRTIGSKPDFFVSKIKASSFSKEQGGHCTSEVIVIVRNRTGAAGRAPSVTLVAQQVGIDTGPTGNLSFLQHAHGSINPGDRKSYTFLFPTRDLKQKLRELDTLLDPIEVELRATIRSSVDSDQSNNQAQVVVPIRLLAHVSDPFTVQHSVDQVKTKHCFVRE